ncbi:MAG: hypothetical protein H0U62_11660 [Actinobacteria bacterium]|nr:hypothetical protein [Actinomycetota bacterium]
MTDQHCPTSEAEGRPGEGLEGVLADLLAAHDLDAELAELTTPFTELVDLHWCSGVVDLVAPEVPEAQEPAEGKPVARGAQPQPGDPAGGLDPAAVRAAMSGLTGLGLPEQAAEQVLTVAVGMRTGGANTAGAPAAARDQQLIDGIQATMVLSRFTDAAMLGMVRELAVAAGQELLARADVAGVDELSMTRRTQWRAQTKSAVASELQALTGWGIQSCHDRVGLALAPGGVAQRAQWALAAGWVNLRDVLDFWRRARNLPVAQAGVVADQVLGPVPDGDGVPVRPSREQFTSRLHRAVVAVEGTDAAAARARRRARLESRDATALLDDDGTATFTVTGPTSAVVAAILRVDSVARRSRYHGDERTIAQLRADLTLTLLVHGILPGEEEKQGQAEEPVSAPASAATQGTAAPETAAHPPHQAARGRPPPIRTRPRTRHWSLSPGRGCVPRWTATRRRSTWRSSSHWTR